MWRNPFETAGDGVDNDGNGWVDDVHGIDARNNDGDPADDNGHGTHIAGTIGAAGNNAVGVAGVNWRVQVMALKFLGADRSGSTADAVRCLNYAASMRARGVNVVVTNNSYNSPPYEQSVRDAIAASGNAGMLFVASAGNGGADSIGDNNDAVPSYPASYDLPNIVSVASTDRWDRLGPSSNYGAASVDLAAPGVQVASTGTGNRYIQMTGTSMAAAHVSGVAALACALEPTATVTQVRDALLAGVDPLASLAGKVATGGRLNAFGTLTALRAAIDPADAVIEGAVWEDADGDGARDAGEGGLAGAVVFLDGNGNGTPDAGERTATSGPDGVYSFTGLRTGTYRVAFTPPAGMRQTAPAAQPWYDAAVTRSGRSVGNDFGAHNPPPTLGSLAAAPASATGGTQVTLTAGGAADTLGGTVARVEFYRETNGAAGLQVGPGGDTLLGADTAPDGSGAYSLAVSTAGLASGSYTYLARALDDRGAASDAVATTQQVTNAAPQAGSLTPASATDPAGTYRTFTADYRDANGAQDLAFVYFRVNEFVPTMLDCVYDAVANKLYVRSEDGARLVGGFAPGSANVISTTHGSLDCALTTVERAGERLTVNWRVSAGQALAAPNTLFLRARDRSGADGGYIYASRWTITGSRAPVAQAPAPAAASDPAGTPRAFSVNYTDSDGWENLGNVYLRANADLPWMLDAVYHVPSNRLYLRNDAGALVGGFAPGSANVISNSHGSLNCAAVTVSAAGNGLTVNWSLTAAQVLAGPNRVFVRATDRAGLDTGYLHLTGATWTIEGNVSPTLAGVTPAAAEDPAGAYRQFTARYADGDGAWNIDYAYLVFNANDPARRVEAIYNAVTNRLYLKGDDNVSALGGFAPGSANVISNGRASLDCATTTVTRSGDTLTVAWSVRPSGALTGDNTIWLRTRDRGGLDTGYRQQPGAVWTVT